MSHTPMQTPLFQLWLLAFTQQSCYPIQPRRLFATMRCTSRNFPVNFRLFGIYNPDPHPATFHVEYHPDYVGTLLHDLGWTRQKPE
jgi:hypothetical protein